MACSGKESQLDAGPGVLSVSPTLPSGHLSSWGLLPKQGLWQFMTGHSPATRSRPLNLSGPFLLSLIGVGGFSISTHHPSKVRDSD